ncbi:MAG: Ig-like domain-containing protein, partial [Actinomycetota bacterium]|nr:Ig-like domain-containing protein [Actinomycetota bacterium]
VLTATLKDAAGNTVTSDNSTVVAFAKQSGAGTVTGTGNDTAVAGVASKTITGALIGSVTMEATSAGLTTGTLGAFTVVHGATADIVLTGAVTDLTSGANRVLTATLKDAAGNTVSSDNSTVVAFAQASGTGTGTVSGTGNDTAVAGVATKTITGQLAGSVTMEATTAGLTTGTLGAFTVVHGAATQISLTGATSNLTSGATRVLTATIKDAAGNTVTNDNTTVVAFTKASGTGTVTGSGNDTAVAGVATKTITGQLTGTVTMEATSAGLTTGTLGAFTVVHGAATQIELAESGSTTAGAAHTLTATIKDGNGNTATDDNSTVVTFAKTSGAGTVTGLGTAVASAGVATKSVTNRLAGAIDLEATASGLTTGTASYTIVVGPVSAADSTVNAAPTSAQNNGTDTTTITVTALDAGGNPLAGKNVTLDDAGATSTISTVTNPTNASGQAIFTATSTAVETAVYSAVADAVAVTDTATVNFVFNDTTPPTNTVTLASAAGAYLSGTTLYYRPTAAGSFTLSSAVVDGGSGPGSATYPNVTQSGWSHSLETVSTPAGGPFVSTAFTWTNATSGNFSHVVTASDAWPPPNTSTTTLNVTEDSTAPAASILCNGAACPAGWFTSSPVSMTLAAPDAGAGLDLIRYTVDGTDPTMFTGNIYAGAFTIATEGVTTVKYRAFDRIGNDTGIQSQLVRIDTVAPQTTIDANPGAATQDTTPTFAFSADETSTFEYSLNGGSWTAATSPLTLGALTENTYTFEVRATDVAGNIDASPASFVFTVDTTPANTTLTSTPPVASSSANASFSFTASDAGPAFECNLDGGGWTSCTSPKAYAGLAEASHTFEVRAKDAAGNVDATPATWTWTVDLTAPQTTILTRPSDPYGDAIATFSFSSNEASSTFRCRVDGAPWSACSSPFSTAALADGAHTFDVEATDAAGNVDATPDSDGWTTDDTNPTGDVTNPADGADIGGTVALTSNSADAGGSGVATVVFQRSPQGANTWTNQAASWNTALAATPDGDYDLRVVTTDNAGNSFTSGTITVTVDNTAPTLSVVAPNVNIASLDPETISATSTDAGSGVASVNFEQCSAANDATCSVDTWTPLGLDTTSPYSVGWPIPADGTRLIRVRATDNAGRQTTQLELVTVDRTRPTGTVTAPLAGANLRGAGVALTATASDTAPGAVNTVTFQSSPAGAGTWSAGTTDNSAPYT